MSFKILVPIYEGQHDVLEVYRFSQKEPSLCRKKTLDFIIQCIFICGIKAINVQIKYLSIL